MKLVHTFSTALVLASGALVFACGGSSNNPAGTSSSTTDAGGTSSNNGTDGGANQSSNPDSGSTVDAGPSCTVASDCTTTGDTCCYAGSLAGHCVPTASCSGVTVNPTCQAASDCTSPQVCCVNISTSGLTSSCLSSCASGSYQLCATAADCPAGDSCNAVYPGASYLVCGAGAATDGGSAPDDAGNNEPVDASAG